MTATVMVIVIVVLVVGAVAGFALARANRSRDGVDSFRRQIDALSPEARRPVVDQVQRIDPRPAGEAGDDTDGSADEGGGAAAGAGDGDAADGADEEGSDGT